MFKKKFRSILIFTLFLLMNAHIIFTYQPQSINKNSQNSEIIIKTADFWTNFTFIHVDNNWTSFGPWLKGDGSEGNPYRIENITIDATNSPTGYGIFIENSKNVHFIINNCTIINAANAGIRLYYCAEGVISNCNSSFNTIGIDIFVCNRTVVSQNALFNNSDTGIKFQGSYNNSFTYNNITRSRYGMDLQWGAGSNYTHNLIEETTEAGIQLKYMYNCSFINNTLINSYKEGISVDKEFSQCLNLNFTGNKMTGGGFKVFGDLPHYLEVHIDTSNLVNGKPVYYYVQKNNLLNENFSNTGQILLYYCNNIEIKRQNITNTSRAIYMQNCKNISITYCKFENLSILGVFCSDGQNLTIEKCNFTNCNEYCINLGATDNCNIINNTIISPNSIGMYISGCKNMTLKNNTMIWCGIDYYLSQPSEIPQDIDTSNTVNGGPLYYYYNAEYLTDSDFIGAKQIILINCNNSVITNLDLSNATQGIITYYCRNITIANINCSYNFLSGIRLQSGDNHSLIKCNFIENRRYGIKSTSTGPLKIFHNNISNTDFGIVVNNKNNNNISSNKISNTINGIYISNADNSVFKQNIFLNNDYGIKAGGADYNNFTKNNFNHSKVQDIYFYSGADSNKIVENKFFNSAEAIFIVFSQYNKFFNNTFTNSSKYAVHLGNGAVDTTLEDNNFLNSEQYGLYCEGGANNNLFTRNLLSNTQLYGVYICSDATGNEFSLNIFQNSGTAHAYDIGTSSQWHNGTYGNRWDDYFGKDADDNGRGDTPYSIAGGVSQDPYPLFWDAPNLIIINPLNFSLYSKAPPEFTIKVEEGVVDAMWYQIIGDPTLYNYTWQIYNLSAMVTTINITAWNNAENGTVQIRFFANDSRNYIASVDAKIKRDVLGPIIVISKPDNYSLYGKMAPNAANFTISFTDGNGISGRWYMMYNGS
ncbi:MAG: right-handed parallel beta-helix repeat-containing protein, partial [Promethearchaeota archaeon]